MVIVTEGCTGWVLGRSSGVRRQARLHVIKFSPVGHPCRAVTVIRLTATVIEDNFVFNRPPAGLVGLVHYIGPDRHAEYSRTWPVHCGYAPKVLEGGPPCQQTRVPIGIAGYF